MASDNQQNDGLTLTNDKPLDYNEHCYEHEIYTECLLYYDLPTHCRYYTSAQFSTKFSSASNNRQNKLSSIHFNARSLKANVSKIKDTIRSMEYKFQIIAISETWLNENNWDGNEVTCNEVAFSGYKLYCNSRKKTCKVVVLPYMCVNICLIIVCLLIFV